MKYLVYHYVMIHFIKLDWEFGRVNHVRVLGRYYELSWDTHGSKIRMPQNCFLANISYYFIVFCLNPQMTSTQSSSFNSVKVFLRNPGESVQSPWLLWKCFSFLLLKITVVKTRDVSGAAILFRNSFIKKSFEIKSHMFT